MFSEALRILDRNTAELMVDRMKDEMEALKVQKDELKAQNEELKSSSEEKDADCLGQCGLELRACQCVCRFLKMLIRELETGHCLMLLDVRFLQ